MGKRSTSTVIDSWDYVPFSEPRIVEALIVNRVEQDKNYGLMDGEPYGVLEATGGMDLDIDRIAVYIDLDRLIETCGQSEMERDVVNWLMDGMSISDIAEMRGISKMTIGIYKVRAVNKICEAHKKRWISCLTK